MTSDAARCRRILYCTLKPRLTAMRPLRATPSAVTIMALPAPEAHASKYGTADRTEHVHTTDSRRVEHMGRALRGTKGLDPWHQQCIAAPQVFTAGLKCSQRAQRQDDGQRGPGYCRVGGHVAPAEDDTPFQAGCCGADGEDQRGASV